MSFINLQKPFAISITNILAPTSYNFENLSLSEDGWQVASAISSSSNIWSPDCVHLATALSNECDFLITSDNSFRKESEKIIKTFKKYKLKIIGVDEAQKILGK